MRWKVWLVVACSPLIVILVLTGLLIYAVLWISAAAALQLLVWIAWSPRGRCALVVYSNSPVWASYFEREVLPAVGPRAVVLNWSERKQWRLSLPVMLFWIFGGAREFNPLAIVFRPFRRPRRFRFYEPFRAFKHGKPEQVEALRRDLLALLDSISPPASR